MALDTGTSSPAALGAGCAVTARCQSFGTGRYYSNMKLTSIKFSKQIEDAKQI